jgi:uncharacterized YigZ family protein
MQTYTLAHEETFSQDVKKSRFLAIAGPITSETAAKDFIASHSDPSANHNCWAWRVGQTYRFNDDGEPTGTAGKPILQALDGQSLDNVAVIVSRWFGGILLGGGGLVRAYGGTASMCLRAASKIPIVVTVEARIACGFADLALVRTRLSALAGVRMAAVNFTESGAEIDVTIAEAEVDATLRLVNDITSGRAAISVPR